MGNHPCSGGLNADPPAQKQLLAFTSLTLAPGGSATVDLVIRRRSLQVRLPYHMGTMRAQSTGPLAHPCPADTRPRWEVEDSPGTGMGDCGATESTCSAEARGIPYRPVPLCNMKASALLHCRGPPQHEKQNEEVHGLPGDCLPIDEDPQANAVQPLTRGWGRRLTSTPISWSSSERTQTARQRTGSASSCGW